MFISQSQRAYITSQRNSEGKYLIEKKKLPSILLVKSSVPFLLNPLYTGGLLHCCMLDESNICHFRAVRFILSLLFYSIFMENSVSKQCRPQSSDLGLHCLLMTFLRVFPVRKVKFSVILVLHICRYYRNNWRSSPLVV